MKFVEHWEDDCRSNLHHNHVEQILVEQQRVALRLDTFQVDCFESVECCQQLLLCQSSWLMDSFGTAHGSLLRSFNTSIAELATEAATLKSGMEQREKGARELKQQHLVELGTSKEQMRFQQAKETAHVIAEHKLLQRHLSRNMEEQKALELQLHEVKLVSLEAELTATVTNAPDHPQIHSGGQTGWRLWPWGNTGGQSSGERKNGNSKF